MPLDPRLRMARGPKRSPCDKDCSRVSATEPIRKFRLHTAAGLDARYRPPRPVNCTPSMKYFWAKKNSNSTGTIYMVANAIVKPGSLPRSLLKSCTA